MKQILSLAAVAAIAACHRSRRVLYLGFAAAVVGCHSGPPERPTPEAKRAMDSAMTAVHDSGGAPDSTAATPRPDAEGGDR